MTAASQPSRRELLISFIFAFLTVLLAGGMGVYVMADRDLQRSTLLTATAIQIRDLYGDEIDVNQMLVNAREAMIARLDRYSGYIEPTRFEHMSEDFTGHYGGVGVSVVSHEDGLLIMSVREGGPAAAVGLLSGDVILKADSAWFRGLTLDEASTHLRGEPGSSVALKVYRPSTDEEIDVAVERGEIDLLHIPFAGFARDSLLYIRLIDFQYGATDDLEAALDSLLQPGRQVRGLILDLRSNSGGLLSEAYRAADLFLEEGTFIVGTDARSRWDNIRYTASSGDKTGGLPIAVMVNRGTASAAEIMAGALRQNERAVLVGDTTFGKGLVQGFTRFDDGSGLRLTISRYYLEGGLYLNEFDSLLVDTGHGLAPDYLSVGRSFDDYPQHLERSGILRRFAHLHEDEILQHPSPFALDRRWIERFRTFAETEAFSFESRRTRSIRAFLNAAEEAGSSGRLITEARGLLRESQEQDQLAPVTYRSYIADRLKQISYERRHGLYRTYRDIIVESQPAIRMAVDILLDTPSPGDSTS